MRREKNAVLENSDRTVKLDQRWYMMRYIHYKAVNIRSKCYQTPIKIFKRLFHHKFTYFHNPRLLLNLYRL